MKVTIRKIIEHNKDVVRQFYKDVGYTPAITDNEIILAAFISNKIVGAVRLCQEFNVLVLRGMHIGGNWQRKGIGTALLHELTTIIEGAECFCLSHDYLETFYGQIGFGKIESDTVPSHLQKRLKEYEHIYSDLIAMKR